MFYLFYFLFPIRSRFIKEKLITQKKLILNFSKNYLCLANIDNVALCAFELACMRLSEESIGWHTYNSSAIENL